MLEAWSQSTDPRQRLWGAVCLISESDKLRHTHKLAQYEEYRRYNELTAMLATSVIINNQVNRRNATWRSVHIAAETSSSLVEPQLTQDKNESPHDTEGKEYETTYTADVL